MDSWLTSMNKHYLSQPCLDMAELIANRLNNRLPPSKSPIGETSLTDDVVDFFDPGSKRYLFGKAHSFLEDRGIKIDARVKKSTFESDAGLDIGFVINRKINLPHHSSIAKYCALVQCKKIERNSSVKDFFHEVGRVKKKQSSLMLDITPNSFYLVYTPSALTSAYKAKESIHFLKSQRECNSPMWNMGYLAQPYDYVLPLTDEEKERAVGLLVVPALAVEACRYRSKSIHLRDLLSNSLPFWFWFTELLITGFIGDRREWPIKVASNLVKRKDFKDKIEGVKRIIEITIQHGVD